MRNFNLNNNNSQQLPQIVVLYGGVGGEREVSLVSGKEVFEALESFYPHCSLYDLQTRSVPEFLEPEQHIVCPILHGEFGEDGQLQALLEAKNIEYIGTNSVASNLCMDKSMTKERVAPYVTVARHIAFHADDKPTAEEAIANLGNKVVLKPNDKGSTIGVEIVEGIQACANALEKVNEGSWLIEQYIAGRELTIGILNGEAMGVVEIRPKSGFYDYYSKYTAGATEYLFPAALAEDTQRDIQRFSEKVFALTGCRDFARCDFILSHNDNQLYFLEINTVPGLTPTSLLPKSAKCIGYDFPQFVQQMISPSLQRWRVRRTASYAS